MLLHGCSGLFFGINNFPNGKDKARFAKSNQLHWFVLEGLLNGESLPRILVNNAWDVSFIIFAEAKFSILICSDDERHLSFVLDSKS